ncbi:acriflavine resistance protein B [Candidatus Endobugula sertula]|uniref:Acriflavine resistance protein B n=1 Tax=Candidatus Endobugula sertula TaxID=62101 RepID=A0A1D2QLF7_9GAMM|nr:acriflavine resistance protein B [Candidatus Endobugula sertula]
MIDWFARNHVAANLLLVGIVLVGLFSLFKRIPLEIFPEFESDIISVNVSLPGATPEDAELGIATRIEEAINDLEGIKEYSSHSTEGGSTVTIEVAKGYHPRDILNDVKNRVDAISSLPVNAERPIVALNVWKQKVITTTIAGNISEREIRELAEEVRDDLLNIPGITQVELTGVRNYEVAIELAQDILREYNLTLQDVAAAVSGSSLDLSAGSVKAEGGDILIRSKGQAYHLADFERIRLKTNADGTMLTLGDIAQVSDGFEETALRTRFNGKLAATVQVYRVGDQSAIGVANKVKDYIASRQANLPQGVELTYWDDDSQIVRNRIKTLSNNAIQGGILVIVLLSLFLRPAVALWVFIGIPVSFLGAFFVMPFIDVSLNLISLFAFILVLGIVVDDAIVTGENVYSHLQKAESGIDAAIHGTKEVALPVTFGVLTTITAFATLAFIQGHRGQVFAQIPAVVVPCLLFSLIESKLVLPAHLKNIKIVGSREFKLNRLQRFQRRFSSGFERAILKYYQPILTFCLQYRWSILLLFIGVLISTIATITSGHMRYTFFPRIPSETIKINLTMPPGTPISVTDTHIQHIEQTAIRLKEKYTNPETGESLILNILSSRGERGGASHKGKVRVEISPPEKRSIKISSPDISRELRQAIGIIPGVEEMTFRAEIGRASDPIDIQLRSNNLVQMTQVAEKIKARLATYPTVFDINDNLSDGKEELRIELKPEAHLLGISRADIINQVRQAFFGVEAQRIQRGHDDVLVMVRFPVEERNAIAHLNNRLITSPTGQQIPLAQLAEFYAKQGPSAINRIDGYRTVSVRADIDKTATNMAVLQADLVDFMQTLSAQYASVSFKFAGEAEEKRESNTSLMWGSLATLLIIYTLLAIPFKSYFQPFIVMSVIPFGIIGAMIGHWIMGMNLTIMSMLGLLALTGVVVNDSLVLVDYINKTRSKNLPLLQAITTAGTARFRPVILTSLTTFIGLLPLLFEKATQAQFLIPMAVSLGFGIIFATAITLILIPINYMLLQDVKMLLRWIIDKFAMSET